MSKENPIIIKDGSMQIGDITAQLTITGVMQDKTMKIELAEEKASSPPIDIILLSDVDEEALAELTVDKNKKLERQRQLYELLERSSGDLSKLFVEFLTIYMEVGDFPFKTETEKATFFVNNYTKYHNVIRSSLIPSAIQFLKTLKGNDAESDKQLR